ncbi:MAG: 3-hydroxyacyl-ACP dehydratase FabZ family protein [Phycisphaerales bacterium]
MHFCLVDAVLERDESRIVTVKQVSNAEEYLGDHFAGFPVLPGVMMLESMVQAARRLLETTGGDPRAVLGGVRALKYGHFVRPGETLRVEVTLAKRHDDGSTEFKGEGRVLKPGVVFTGTEPVAVSGKFTLRPLRRS